MQSKRNLSLELKKAIEKNDSQQIKKLVELKADPDACFNTGGFYFPMRTALLHAIDHHKTAAIGALLESKANPNLCVPPHTRDSYHSNYQVYHYLIPLNHALSTSIFRDMNDEEKQMQPKQIINGLGQTEDILENYKIIQLLLKYGAEIMEEDLGYAAGNQYHTRNEALLKLLTEEKEKREFPAIKAEIVSTFNFFSTKMNMPNVLVDMIGDMLKPKPLSS